MRSNKYEVSIIIIIIIIYTRRQHNITSPLQRQHKHTRNKKLKYTKIRNNKANHTANETVVRGSVNSSFLESLPDTQFDFKVRSGWKWTIDIILGS